MIRSVRAWFLGRQLREKLLLLAFAFGLAAVWFSSWSTRAANFWTEQRHTSSELKTQSLWLANRAAIERAATAAAAQLNQADTLNSTRLVAAVHSLADEAGLSNYHTDDPTDVSNGQFAIHTVAFTVNKITWGALLPFYVNLQKKAPYLVIESMALVGDRGSPDLLSATIKISSVEVTRESP